MPLYKPILERFQEKYRVNLKTGCWDWLGAKAGMGYGKLGGERGTAMVIASRFSYEHFKGPIPDGMLVLHRCDNPGCVNPDHLELGDHEANMAEMRLKGRARLLSASQTGEAISRREQGQSVAAIARYLGVSRKTIDRALKMAEAGDIGGVGRSQIGSYVVLTEAQREEVKATLAQPYVSVMAVAKRFGIDRRTARNIRDGKSGSMASARAARRALTAEETDQIRSVNGISQQRLGELYSVAQTTISRVRLGRQTGDSQQREFASNPYLKGNIT
jgi:transposase-like protein